MSSGSIRIIQLPEKSSVNTDDYMAVDSSANGTKKVKFTDLLDDNLSVQNKAADAQATGEAINNVSARVDNMINTQTNAEVTTLWTGTLNTYNQEVTLLDNVSNYDFIDIYVSQLDYKFIRRPINSLTGIQIQGQNMLDSGSTDNIEFWEGGLNISGNKAKIVKANSMIIYGYDTYTKPTGEVNTSIPSITRIDGVKIGHVDNDEIVDARVSANGTIYPTLGDAIRGQVTDLESELNDISAISIDGYSRDWELMNTTIVNGAYIDTSGNPAVTSAWSYCYANVNQGETYKVTGVAGTGARLYVLKDANNVVIDTYQSEVNVEHRDLEYTIPSGGATLYVNTSTIRIATPLIKKHSYNFAKSDSAGSVKVTNQSGTQYSIDADIYTHIIDLYGSANGTFTFKELKVGSSSFKPVNDDITPINIGTVGYVGANHGYIWVYECTITSHGLTIADIGKESTDGTNRWVLIQVVDADKIVVGCYDSTAWFRLKRIAPTSLNFGSGDLVVSTSALAQLYPSVKNVDVSIDDSSSEKTIITEQYDIIDVGSGIDAIRNNVGSNTNNSVAERANAVARISNVYEFQSNGAVVIYASTRLLKTDIVTNFVSFIQSGAFTNSDSFWIPEMTSYNGYIPETGTQIDFSKGGWLDGNKPPQEYIQANGNISSASKVMILGYIINDNRQDYIANTAGFVSAAGKMYPHFVQPNTSIGEVVDFSTISYRIPCTFNHFASVSGFNMACNYIFVGNDIYLFINTHLSNGNIDFPLPEFMRRKKIETVMSRNMECQSDIVATSVSIKYGVRGSIILRLYD